MKDSKIEKSYNGFKKKYNLPEFKIICNEFDLYSLKDIEEEQTLTKIRHKMTDKITYFIEIIEDIIHPLNMSISLFKESSFFTDEKKQELIELLKHLKILEKNSLIIDIDNGEKKEIEFIKTILKLWPTIKKQMKDILLVVRKAWQEEDKSTFKFYFG